MVKAPILSPTPPSSASLSPTNEDQQIDPLEETEESHGGVEISPTITTTTTTTITVTEPSSTAATSALDNIPKELSTSTHMCSLSDDQNSNNFKKVKIRFDDIVMGDKSISRSDSSDSVVIANPDVVAAQVENYRENVDEADSRAVLSNGSGQHGNKSDNGETASVDNKVGSGVSSDECRSIKINEIPKTITTTTASTKTLYASPITVGLIQTGPPSAATQLASVGTHQQPAVSTPPQIQATGPPPPPAGGPHHPHHHLFPVHVISIPQPPPGSGAVTGAWPLVEPPIYVDANGEHRHYCPAHSQGPAPREHRVLLQLDAGVSLPLQIAGKRKVFRGESLV